jgi:ABC-type nitrate/sulfonate/bicarbonate transport system substrate-binding protein
MANILARLSVLLLTITIGFASNSEAQAPKKVRFAYPSSADMGDIPSLLAWEALKKQGIEVVPTFFPKTDLAVQAVVAGEADIGSAADRRSEGGRERHESSNHRRAGAQRVAISHAGIL